MGTLNLTMKISPSEYLTSRGIEFVEKGNELIMCCPVGDCDVGKKAGAGHFYMNAKEGTSHCFKCDAKFNMITLARHFGDNPAEFGFKEQPEQIGSAVKKRAKTITVSLPPEQVDLWHSSLPENIKEWLVNERGLVSEIISQAKIGWDGERITIPISDGNGGWLFTKSRTPPGSLKEPRYKYPAGAKSALYGLEAIKDSKTVVIAEGEFDSLILRSRGIAAVSSTGGAGTFEPEWADIFKAIPSVFITYDNDLAGKNGAIKVGKLIPHAKIVQLPAEVGEKGDVTDFFMKLDKDADDFLALLQTGRTAQEVQAQGERHLVLPKPSEDVSVVQWRNTVGALFPECINAGEVGLAVVLQLLINDIRNPFGLVYVDVPSAGKTITLNFFSELDELVYSTDNFTPSSLVSHASNRKQEDLEKIDLLPRIRFKTVIVRDLAPIFAERQENLLKNLGVLTRVFDGEGYESDSGVHGNRGYRGDYTFMFLAGSTPIAPRVWKFMGNLGSRLFFLNLGAPDKDENELADLLIQDDFKRKEKECRTAKRNAILTLWNKYPKGVDWDKKSDPVELRKIISRCAQLLARLRGTTSVWEDDGSSGEKNQHHTNVVIEKPTRINQLLYNLARGHALLCGRVQITNEDIWPIVEVTLNSAQYNRIKLFESLLKNHGTINTKLAEWSIDCSNPTALKEIETLRVLGIVDVQSESSALAGRPEKIVTLKKEFEWFCSEECLKLRELKSNLTPTPIT